MSVSEECERGRFGQPGLGFPLQGGNIHKSYCCHDTQPNCYVLLDISSVSVCQERYRTLWGVSHVLVGGWSKEFQRPNSLGFPPYFLAFLFSQVPCIPIQLLPHSTSFLLLHCDPPPNPCPCPQALLKQLGTPTAPPLMFVNILPF